MALKAATRDIVYYNFLSVYTGESFNLIWTLFDRGN
jgi:hypothetical protein